jgi:hypothetical protein
MSVEIEMGMKGRVEMVMSEGRKGRRYWNRKVLVFEQRIGLGRIEGLGKIAALCWFCDGNTLRFFLELISID